VVHFLDTLLDYRRPYALDALHALAQRKQAHLGLQTLPIIQAWDRDYYCPPDPPAPVIPVPSLSIGTVFMALSRLYKHLYGISLRPAEISPGEVWHSDVSKLEVVDENEGLIGWIYTDVHARRGKASGAAHYTVRCSRRIDDDDEAGDLMVEGGESIAQTSLDFEREKYLQHRDGRVLQLPLVVLLCEFSRPPSNGKTILEWHEVVTLFHEMGHAMHCKVFFRNYLCSRLLIVHSHDRSNRISQCGRHPLRN
jgi:mitochondrial intermediate peptidase